MKAIALLCFTLFSNTLCHAADDCSYVRLDDPGKSMEHVPVTDQGHFGSCYAVTASELVDAYRFSHKSGDQNFKHLTNYMEVMASNLDYDGNKISVDTPDAIDIIKKHGSCDRRVSGDGNDEKYNFLNYLKNSFNIYHNLPEASKAKFGLAEDVSCVLPKVLGTPIEKLTMDVSKVLITKDDVLEFMKSIFELACKDHRQQVNLPKLWKTGWFREHAPPPTEKIQKQINERLSQPEPVQPVGIGYCANVLWDPTYMGYEQTLLGGVKQPDCAGHASVIIGRRRDPKTTRCEYLVQNSMGTDCKMPSEMPNGDIRRISYPSRWTCDHGRIWIDAEALGNNIVSIALGLVAAISA